MLNQGPVGGGVGPWGVQQVKAVEGPESHSQPSAEFQVLPGEGRCGAVFLQKELT